MAVERSNLLDVFKLVVKELLDTSLSFGRMLDDTHAPLQQFFVIIDHIFRHAIKRNLLVSLYRFFVEATGDHMNALNEHRVLLLKIICITAEHDTYHMSENYVTYIWLIVHTLVFGFVYSSSRCHCCEN